MKICIEPFIMDIIEENFEDVYYAEFKFDNIFNFDEITLHYDNYFIKKIKVPLSIANMLLNKSTEEFNKYIIDLINQARFS